MRNLFFAFIISLVCGLAFAGECGECPPRYKSCVTPEQAIDALSVALNMGTSSLTIAGTITDVDGVIFYSDACGPCDCGDDESSECYEHLADEARAREENERQRSEDLKHSRKILRRMRDFGVCCPE